MRIYEGAIIDTFSNNIAINQNLVSGGSGGLTKIGSGRLTLNGANTYTGDTLAREGTLALNTAQSGGGAIIVSNPPGK